MARRGRWFREDRQQDRVTGPVEPAPPARCCVAEIISRLTERSTTRWWPRRGRRGAGRPARVRRAPLPVRPPRPVEPPAREFQRRPRNRTHAAAPTGALRDQQRRTLGPQSDDDPRVVRSRGSFDAGEQGLDRVLRHHHPPAQRRCGRSPRATNSYASAHEIPNGRSGLRNRPHQSFVTHHCFVHEIYLHHPLSPLQGPNRHTHRTTGIRVTVLPAAARRQRRTATRRRRRPLVVLRGTAGVRSWACPSHTNE